MAGGCCRVAGGFQADPRCFRYAAYHPTQAPPHVRDDIALQLNMGEAHVRLVASCRRYVRISKQSSKQSSK